MNRLESITKPLMWFMALLFAALAAGCGGGGAPILGGGGGGTLTAATLVDVIKPRVTSTVPADLAVIAPANAAITATFTEAMNPATIIAANFTVVSAGPTTPGAVIATTVTYNAASKTAIFAHGGLASGDVYTATITTAATDVAGNALAGNQAALPAASNYVWTFTASGNDITLPTITLENPADGDTGVAINASVNATFSEAMDPTTICGPSNLTAACPVATFTLAPAVAGVVTYDPVSFIATFNPTGNLAPNTLYTATVGVTNTVTDLAGNILAVPELVPPINPWSFTTGTVLAPSAVSLLGTADTFGIMATAAVTAATASIINGDVSLEPGTSMTGFPPAVVNGQIHINDTVSHQARADLLAAYNTLKGLACTTTVTAALGSMFVYPTGIPPGVYCSDSTMLVNVAAPIVLDGGGNANAVWVFQIGSSMTSNANVTLTGGAQAKNVFWVPTSDMTVGSGTIFNGTIVAGRDATSAGNATLNGRILAGAITAGTIALNGPPSTVNVPLP